MPKRHLSRTEVIKANNLLTQHLLPSGKDGFYKYQEGWDDAKIAQEIDPAIQAHAIGNLRVELFGKLDTQFNVTKADNAKYEELKTLTQNLLDCYGNLEKKYNLLIDTLALNRTVPTSIRHLKTTINGEAS